MYISHSVIFLCAHKSRQGFQEKFCKGEQDCFGARGKAETSIKIEDLRSNKTTGNFHKCFTSCASEFRSLSEFYIINFLNKLKIVEN